MIVTVTLNPAVDEALAIERFELGGLNRCSIDDLDAGGKGINASRVIRRLGRETLALGFLGGATGDLIRARLNEEGVPHAFDEIDEWTRVNVMLYERANGRRTRMYLPGAAVPAERLADLRARLRALPAKSVVVLAGSLPPGSNDTTYRDLIAALNESGAQVVLDTSGPALREARPARPALVKPNVHEAGEILGRVLSGDDDVVRAAFQMRALGAKSVVISQGAAGAVGVDEVGCWKAIPPHVPASSTVGSGDSMVGALAVALDERLGLAEGLRLGTAAGAATAMTEGTHLCRMLDVERLLPDVRVGAIHRSLAPLD